MQPCQPQEPVQRPPAGNSWDSSDHLNCVAPLDGSGDFLLESLFPEFYDVNHDDSNWSGDMSALQYSGLMHTNGVGNLHGLHAGLTNERGFDADTFTFDVVGGHTTASINPSPVSSGHVPSTLPTPASSFDINRSKKRPSNDDHAARTASPHSESSSEPTDKVVKRQRNTEAARRYRQRKVDRVTELEEALAAMTKERDDYKLKLARSEAEVDVLRRLVGKGD